MSYVPYMHHWEDETPHFISLRYWENDHNYWVIRVSKCFNLLQCSWYNWNWKNHSHIYSNMPTRCTWKNWIFAARISVPARLIKTAQSSFWICFCSENWDRHPLASSQYCWSSFIISTQRSNSCTCRCRSAV